MPCASSRGLAAATALLVSLTSIPAGATLGPVAEENATTETVPAEAAPTEDATPTEAAPTEDATPTEATATEATTGSTSTESDGARGPSSPDDTSPDPDATGAEPPDSGGDENDNDADTPADDEAPTVDDPLADVPKKLPRLQQAGWWTVFAGVSVAAISGIFAGLVKREQDRAVRLSTRIDLDIGAQLPYEDVQSDYEEALDRGQAYETTAITLGAIAGATVAAGISLFIVDAVRRRRGKTPSRARIRLHPTGVRMRF